MKVVRPPALAPGDRVAVLAPSSPVFRDELDAGLAALRSWGYEVVEGAHLRTAHGHLAGRDRMRSDDLSAALADPSVRAVFAGRGGYGAQRLVDLVDWHAFGADPTLLVGFSDFTALLAAAWTRARVTSVHGPFVGQLDRLTDADQERLRTLLTGAAPPDIRFDAGQVLVPGRATGPLVGGNLSLLSTSIGTSGDLDTTGAVLFLEDVNEPPYAVDRMLTQLRRAGKLEQVSAVLVGAWVGCEPPADRPSATVEDVTAERLGDLGVPLVAGLAIGHRLPRLAVPYGATCRLHTGAGTLQMDAAAV